MEEKYQQKFSDVEGESPPITDIIQPEISYFVEVALSFPKELGEISPIFEKRKRNLVSKRTAQTFDGSPNSRKLVSSLEQIGEYKGNDDIEGFFLAKINDLILSYTGYWNTDTMALLKSE